MVSGHPTHHDHSEYDPGDNCENLVLVIIWFRDDQNEKTKIAVLKRRQFFCKMRGGCFFLAIFIFLFLLIVALLWQIQIWVFKSPFWFSIKISFQPFIGPGPSCWVAFIFKIRGNFRFWQLEFYWSRYCSATVPSCISEFHPYCCLKWPR